MARVVLLPEVTQVASGSALAVASGYYTGQLRLLKLGITTRSYGNFNLKVNQRWQCGPGVTGHSLAARQ